MDVRFASGHSLLRDLQGYEEYKNKVRYRLIPYIW
jgi:protein-S-isoprenylcysteine O-methyltransferase Ste14